MIISRPKSLFLLTVVGLVLLLSGIYVLSKSRRGKVIESWQTGNNTFEIRVTVHSEKLSLPGLGGAYYVFSSNIVGSESWTEFLVFRHDTPVLIPREQVHFVNDKIAYVFMGWLYGVTTDGGATWTVWNAERDLRDWECCNYNLIQEVRIGPDGVGTMRLDQTLQRRGEVPELHTQDYGRNWSVK